VALSFCTPNVCAAANVGEQPGINKKKQLFAELPQT
jgi:hypothetical protein